MRIAHLVAVFGLALAAGHAQAAQLQAVSDLNMRVAYGQSVNLVVASDVRNQPLYLSASCGTLNPINASLDNGGYGIIHWVAPASSAAGSICNVTVSLASGAGVTFGMYLPDAPPLPAALQGVTGTSPSGGMITLAVVGAKPCITPGIPSGLQGARFLDPRVTEFSIPLPRGVAYPHGLVSFDVRFCSPNQTASISLDFPGTLPPTAQWWTYGATSDNATPHWYALDATIQGNRITFTILEGSVGDDDLMANNVISHLGMLAIPGGEMQDLWWSGSAENGWGLSIVQHRDVLFANVFAYDAQGVATWYVMPSGSWDSSHVSYTGALYFPRGSPYYAYDASKFDVGASVGTATLTFVSSIAATFDYTINGVSGRKILTRIPFGPQAAPLDSPVGDLWWAGVAQNGWGIAIAQQYSTLFAIWYTYDANGKATWFVMPDIRFVFRGVYNGSIYRPEGPPWLGVPYDASRHRTVPVGTFVLRFSGDTTTFEYTLDGKTGSIPLTRIPF